MGKIIWTLEAEKWLEDIYSFISKDNEQTGTDVVRGIYEKTQVLKQHPKIGYKYREEPEGEVRILLYGHYRITYLYTKSEDIKILGVFHGSLDIDRYFP